MTRSVVSNEDPAADIPGWHNCTTHAQLRKLSSACPALPPRHRPSEDAADASQRDAADRRRARQQRRQAREERRRKLRAYYSAGSGWGRPAAGVLYDIANRFSLDDSLLLWCAQL